MSAAAAAKKARLLSMSAKATTQEHPDIWSKMFQFLSSGRYLQLASVSCGWRALYANSKQQQRQRCADFTTTASAVVASVPLLQWAIANGWPEYRALFIHAAACDNLEVLQHLDANFPQWQDGIGRQVSDGAAAGGHLEALRWLHANDCPFDDVTFSHAAGAGHLEMLRWLHARGCPWGPGACEKAAMKGQLDALRFLHENGCPWTGAVCGIAASSGRLDMLQYAIAQGCAWDEVIAGCTFGGAASGGHLELMQWAYASGCPVGATADRACIAVDAAASKGHIAVVQWLRSIGQPWSTSTCASAARGGKLAMLQYLRQSGCPWDSQTCLEAAANGHLEVLQWSRAASCPWDSGVIETASKAYNPWNRHGESQLAAVEWALANGCPCDDTARSAYLWAAEKARRWRSRSTAQAGDV